MYIRYTQFTNRYKAVTSANPHRMDQGRVRSDEDEQCALYLRNLLQGRRPAASAIKRLILKGGATQKFFDDSQPQYHPKDVELALQVNRYPFAMRVTREDGLLVARKHAV